MKISILYGYMVTDENLSGGRTRLLHRRIERELRSWIQEGQLGKGARLPSTRELCVKFGGVNHQTVRHALKTLIDEGLLESSQGRGVFVASSIKKNFRVALILPNLEDEFTVQIAQGASTVLNEGGFHSVIMDAGRNAERELANIRQLEDLPLDGAIIFPLPYSDMAEQILRLKIDHFPFVLVDSYLPALQTDVVTSDDYREFYDLTKALLQKGYRRIAWLGIHQPLTIRDRLDGYRDALGDFDLPVKRNLIRYVDVEGASPIAPFHENAEKVIRELVDGPARPDAIMCANDLIALFLLEQMQRMGLRAPADIAVTGFDGLHRGTTYSPTLTTVQRPIAEMGSMAARMLLERIENKRTPFRRVVLRGEVVLRQSA